MTHPPQWIRGEILRRDLDGESDDLLTAGLGATGLAGSPPALDDGETGTADPLRRLAIYTNYRGLFDMTEAGGYGSLYGPHVAPDGTPTGGEGRIAGREYLALAAPTSDPESGAVTLMVQIPATFDPKAPVIVATASSGSRGIYGAVGVVGEWALKRGFAVAYTDKGTGNAVHDIDAGTVSRLTGERTDAASAGPDVQFVAEVSPDYSRRHPHRLAFPHAHSGTNPEAHWGDALLRAVHFAFYILNLPENFGQTLPSGEVRPMITKDRTLVIASGISNGGAAALRAAEIDDAGLIDGVAVSEPNVCPADVDGLAIRQGDRVWTAPDIGRPLFDHATLVNLLQPCADLAPANRPFTAHLTDDGIRWRRTRCRRLTVLGMLSGRTPDEQGRSAQAIINAAGIIEEQNPLAPIHWEAGVSESIAVTYAAAYGRFRIDELPLGLGFAAVDPETRQPRSLSSDEALRLFAEGNGIPPTGPVRIVAEPEPGTACPVRETGSTADEPDGGLDAALRLRSLWTGTAPDGGLLSDRMRAAGERVRAGVAAVRATGRLKGKPVLVVHGRADAVLPVNHTSRAYVAANHRSEGEAGGLRYYEVPHAHHLDAMNALPGVAAACLPLHPYLMEILDRLYDHLRHGRPLPPSQVVRTTPRGVDEAGNVPPITRRHIPPLSGTPAETDIIHFNGAELVIEN